MLKSEYFVQEYDTILSIKHVSSLLKSIEDYDTLIAWIENISYGKIDGSTILPDYTCYLSFDFKIYIAKNPNKKIILMVLTDIEENSMEFITKRIY